MAWIVRSETLLGQMNIVGMNYFTWLEIAQTSQRSVNTACPFTALYCFLCEKEHVPSLISQTVNKSHTHRLPIVSIFDWMHRYEIWTICIAEMHRFIGLLCKALSPCWFVTSVMDCYVCFRYDLSRDLSLWHEWHATPIILRQELQSNTHSKSI